MPKETDFTMLRGMYNAYYREVDLGVNIPKLIREVQTKLLENNFLTSESQITGVFDAATKTALENFKNSLSLQYPTSVGQTTASRLLGQ